MLPLDDDKWELHPEMMEVVFAALGFPFVDLFATEVSSVLGHTLPSGKLPVQADAQLSSFTLYFEDRFLVAVLSARSVYELQALSVFQPSHFSSHISRFFIHAHPFL